MRHCWYCHKPLPYEYDLVVTINGERRPVCHDDRTCRPYTGIKGRGKRPAAMKRPKISKLQKAKERNRDE